MSELFKRSRGSRSSDIGIYDETDLFKRSRGSTGKKKEPEKKQQKKKIDVAKLIAAARKPAYKDSKKWIPASDELKSALGVREPESKPVHYPADVKPRGHRKYSFSQAVKKELADYYEGIKGYPERLKKTAEKEKEFQKKHGKELLATKIAAETASSISEPRAARTFAQGGRLTGGKTKRVEVKDNSRQAVIDEIVRPQRERIPQSPASKATEGPVKAVAGIGALAAAGVSVPAWVWSVLGAGSLAHKAATPKETLRRFKEKPVQEAAFTALDLAMLGPGARALKLGSRGGKSQAGGRRVVDELKPPEAVRSVAPESVPTRTTKPRVAEPAPQIPAKPRAQEPTAEPQELWQMTLSESLKKPGANRIARSAAHKAAVKSADEEGAFEAAVKSGAMTPERASEIIASAGIKGKTKYTPKPLNRVRQTERTFETPIMADAIELGNALKAEGIAFEASRSKALVDGKSLYVIKPKSGADYNKAVELFSSPEFTHKASAKAAEAARILEKKEIKAAISSLKVQAKEIEDYKKTLADYPKWLQLQPKAKQIAAEIAKLEQRAAELTQARVRPALPKQVQPGAPRPVQPKPAPKVQGEKPAITELRGAQTQEPPAPSSRKEKLIAAQTQKPGQVRVTEVKGTGQMRTRGLSAGVEQKAVEKKLVESLGDLPEYSRVNMKEQANKASELLAKDPESAVRVALGHKAPPPNLLPESVFTAVENKALSDGNVELLRQLANSTRATEATVMGQRIRALAERNPDSAVGAIKKVQDARVQALEKKLGKSVDKAFKEITTEIKATMKKPGRQDWGKFINELRCKL